MSDFNVQIDEEIFNAAELEGKANFRSAENQINFWVRVGRTALANPELPIGFIVKVLSAKNQETALLILKDNFIADYTIDGEPIDEENWEVQVEATEEFRKVYEKLPEGNRRRGIPNTKAKIKNKIMSLAEVNPSNLQFHEAWEIQKENFIEELRTGA